MRFKKSVLFLLVSLILIMVSGCSAKPLPPDTVRGYSDSITENMLIAMNEDDYPRFSQDFDEQMKAAMTEAKYNSTIPPIKAKIGKYISKDFVAAELQDGFIVAIYNARFSGEPRDVTVRCVFSDIKGKKAVSGFWLDSPKLRGN